jgi:hypothetical protein
MTANKLLKNQVNFLNDSDENIVDISVLLSLKNSERADPL